VDTSYKWTAPSRPLGLGVPIQGSVSRAGGRAKRGHSFDPFNSLGPFSNVNSGTQPNTAEAELGLKTGPGSEGSGPESRAGVRKRGWILVSCSKNLRRNKRDGGGDEIDGRHVKDTAAVPRSGAAREGCDVRETTIIPSLICEIREGNQRRNAHFPSQFKYERRNDTDGRHVKDTAAVPRSGAAREGCDAEKSAWHDTL